MIIIVIIIINHYDYNQNDHHKSNQTCLHECRVLLHGRKSPWALLLLLTGIDCDNDQDHDADEDDNHDDNDNDDVDDNHDDNDDYDLSPRSPSQCRGTSPGQPPAIVIRLRS